MCPRSRCAAGLGGFGLLCALLTGCGPSVREDRAASFAADGRAGFQHGRAGVFIADPAGGSPRCIYTPGPDVVAVSTPLWTADGKKLIFTTARTGNPSPAGQPQMPSDPAPGGTVYFQQPVTYTCWLHDTTVKDAKPQRLFDADLGHAGYVAANLAVRWSPAGEAVLFLRANGQQIGLHRFDLASATSKQIFPHAAEALLFDFTPTGAHLCCVLGNTQPGADDGVWVGKVGGADWWHVPGSESPPPGDGGALIERLRAARPAWTADGARFAFLAHKPDPQPEKSGTHLLKVGTLATKTVETRLEDAQPLREVRWSPDGKRLGLLRGGDRAELRLLDAAGGPATTVAKVARTFAGWDAAGKQLAFIAADDLPYSAGEPWALLFAPHEDARDAVCVSTEAGPPRRLVEGFHASFPRWSPDGAKLSVWLTFESPYSVGLGQGALPPRDPAALIDVATGAVSWQPVNLREKAQLAHHHLRKHDYAQAWKRYAEIEADPAAGELPELPLYIAHCLTKLGRSQEAKPRLDRFQKSSPKPADGPSSLNPLAMGGTNPLGEQFTRLALAAEVYLSLDEPDAAVAFLRQALKDAPDEMARGDAAVMLGQLLLLLDRRADYMTVVTDALLPTFLKSSSWPAEKRDGFRLLAEVTGLPAASPAFLAGVPDDALKGLPARWSALKPLPGDDLSRLAIDVLQEAAYAKLKREPQRQQAAARVQANQAKGQYLPNGVDAALGEVRKFREQWVALVSWLGG
ncbi:MAG: hypothetical protein ACJ8F7_22305 [Gemmataceae bacterium]